jgi:hypothetical protein
MSNCAKMALPKVSAVMPVPSETKKTLRLDMVAKNSNEGGTKPPKMSRLSMPLPLTVVLQEQQNRSAAHGTRF